MREIKFKFYPRKGYGTEPFIKTMNEMRLPSNSTTCYEICQYTGLKDENGVEIYEGDIVRILYTDWASNTDPNISLEDYLISISHVGEVVYQAPEFGILMVKEDRYGERPICSFNHGTHGRIEVIGNRFEHPTLLTPNAITKALS